jgi:hypothetical protein
LFFTFNFRFASKEFEQSQVIALFKTEEDFTEDDFEEMAKSATINQKKRQREMLSQISMATE